MPDEMRSKDMAADNTHETVKDYNDAIFYARYNYNLHCLLANYYYRFELFLTFLSALSSSATLYKVIVDPNQNWSGLWTVVVLVATIASITRGILTYSKTHISHVECAATYSNFEWGLSPNMDIASIRRELGQLATKEPKIVPLSFYCLECQADEKTRNELNRELTTYRYRLWFFRPSPRSEK